MPAKSCLAACLVLITPGLGFGTAYGAPGTATNWLTDNPASMMDLGLHRLEHWLQSSFEDMAATLGADYYTGTGYDWENDEIKLFLTIRVDSYTIEQATRACDAYIWRVRAYALVQPAQGNLLPGLTNSRLSDEFAHEGFARANAPSDWKQDIDERIRIICWVFQKNDDQSASPVFKMEGDLLSRNRSITE